MKKTNKPCTYKGLNVVVRKTPLFLSLNWSISFSWYRYWDFLQVWASVFACLCIWMNTNKSLCMSIWLKGLLCLVNTNLYSTVNRCRDVPLFWKHIYKYMHGWLGICKASICACLRSDLKQGRRNPFRLCSALFKSYFEFLKYCFHTMIYFYI